MARIPGVSHVILLEGINEPRDLDSLSSEELETLAAEIRTLATDPALRRRGVGHAVIERLVETARELGVARLFCLTFETGFFGRHGFVEIDGTPVEHEVFEQLLQSYDEGVAEFLDLERVKPNTLGNHRMLLVL